MPKSYRVTSHWGPLLLSVGMLMLLIYFILDTFLLAPWRHVSLWPVLGFAIIGIGAAAGAWYVGRAAPSKERLGVALMLGAAVGLALWPASLRLNALGAGESRESVFYEAVKPGVYEPVDGDYPTIRFLGDDQYWELAEELGQRRFHFIRGSLGFRQMDYRPIRDDIRYFNANLAQ